MRSQFLSRGGINNSPFLAGKEACLGNGFVAHLGEKKNNYIETKETSMVMVLVWG